MTVERNSGAAVASLPDEPATGRGAYKWYVLGILASINLISAVDRGVISVITEPLKAEFRLSDKQVGLLSGTAFSVTFALAVMPLGWLVDRVNRRRLLSFSVTIWSVLTAICGASASFITLFIARMGVGAAEAPTAPASLSLIADTFPLKLRNTAVSLFLAGAGFGAMLQFLIGAWLLAHFGWRTVFLVAGGPGILLGSLLYFTTREPERGAFEALGSEAKESAKHAPKTIDALRSILGNPALCFAIPAIMIATGVFYSLVMWTTSFLVRVHGMSVSAAAVWTGMGFGLCLTIGSLLAGPVADRFSRGDQRKLALIPAAATFVAAIAGMVLTMSNVLPIALGGLAVLGFMAGFYLGPGYSIVLSLSVPNERGTTMALTKLITTLVGGSAITFITGAISDAVGGHDSIRPALLFNAALLLLSTFCFLMIRYVLGPQNKGRSFAAE